MLRMGLGPGAGWEDRARAWAAYRTQALALRGEAAPMDRMRSAAAADADGSGSGSGLEGFVATERRKVVTEGFVDSPSGESKWMVSTPEGSTSLEFVPRAANAASGWDQKKKTVLGADGRMAVPQLRTDVLNLGNKWRFSGVGDAHANDGWLRMFDKNGKDYSGGLAMAQLWVRDNSYLNGTTTTNGSFISNGYAYFRGGVSEHNPGGWQTHFPWPGNNQNYIRGDTEMRGNTNNIGDLTVGRNANIAGRLTVSGALDARGSLGVGGGFVARGSFESQSNDAKFRGGVSEHNPGGWQTHFPWPGNNKNYIRGDTEIRGNTDNIGDLSVGRRLCIGGTCITGSDLQAFKSM